MFSKTCLVFAAATFLGNVAIVSAQTAEDRGALHPNTSVPEVIRPPTATSAGMGEVDIRKMNRLTLMMPTMRGLLGVMPVDHVEGRIAYRKADLAITDAQLPEWDAFAAALRVDAKAMQDAIMKIMNTGGPSTAPARGEAMVELMTTRLEGMRAVVEAERALYNVLSAEQRQTADNLIAGPVGAMEIPAAGDGHRQVYPCAGALSARLGAVLCFSDLGDSELSSDQRCNGKGVP